MHLFKPVLKTDQNSGPANSQYLIYEPRTFSPRIPEQAIPFARSQEANAEPALFTISGLVAETTKLQGLEQKNFQSRVQGEVLSRLKDVEEKAYAEAHSLGLTEGREKGFTETKGEVQTSVENIKNIVSELTELKKKLVVKNEEHIIETIFHIAKSIALDQITANPENIKNVILKSLENAQSEEEITLRLSPADTAFLEKVRESVGNPFEKMLRLKIETSDTITPGGVVVETNYGVVDATIEQRIKKVREAILSKVPKV
jgi:flagellar biosynthesis/type III secretory pathway protein FliH